MNHLESQLDYPFGETLPDTGMVHEVAPGIMWLRMGLPFALNHINLWLLEDEFETESGPVQGWTVIGSMDSPILGGDGNKEYLLAAARGTDVAKKAAT